MLGKKEFNDITPEEMGAVIGFVKPEHGVGLALQVLEKPQHPYTLMYGE